MSKAETISGTMASLPGLAPTLLASNGQPSRAFSSRPFSSAWADLREERGQPPRDVDSSEGEGPGAQEAEVALFMIKSMDRNKKKSVSKEKLIENLGGDGLMMSMGQPPVMVQDLEMVRVQIYLRGTGCGVCMKKIPKTRNVVC